MAPPAIATSHRDDHDTGELAAAKAAAGVAVSVCLPARNEEATVGAIVEAVRRELAGGAGLVDEVLVMDDHSTDRTAVVAADAGATVIDAAGVLAELGPGHGKGEALWKSLFAAKGDLIVWCDADIIDFDVHFVTGLLGPLLTSPEIQFVKGFYERPVAGETGGGRVTELAARPALSLLFPDLAGVIQPLAGEYAGRRGALEQLPFASGYGVDLGLLIDVFRTFGPSAMAQVDLGVRVHRNRTLQDLGPQALSVLHAVFSRAGVDLPEHPTLVRPGLDPVTVRADDLPPLREVAAYQERANRPSGPTIP
jgi:glucosyl-3-phosphoglycerate synthase